MISQYLNHVTVHCVLQPRLNFPHTTNLRFFSAFTGHS